VAPTRPRFSGRRVARVVVYALTLGAILYVVGINAFLATPLFESVIDADPFVIDIHFQRGWSILPGRIHAKELSIRGRDSNVEWILRLDDVTFDVSLPGLTRRRFDVSRARGNGLSLRIRSRIDAQSITSEKIANLPPIEGFGPIPLRPFQRETEDEWSDAAYRLWTIHLANVVADDVREVWIDHARFQGSASVRGGFYLRPIRAVAIGPAHAAIASGSLRIVGIPVLDSAAAGADMTLAQFDPRVVRGADLVHRVSLDLDGRATCPTLANLPIPLHDEVDLAGQVDVRSLVVHVKDGVLRSDSRLDAKVPRIAAALGEIRVVGALSLAADVEGPAGHERLDLRAALENARVGEGLLQASRVGATGDAHALDLAHPLGDLHLSVETDDLELPDARMLLPYLQSDGSVVARSVRAGADARVELWLADQRAAGRARVRADDVDLSVGKVRAWGAGSVAVVFAANVAGPLRFENLAVDAQSKRLRIATQDLNLVADLQAHAQVRDWLWPRAVLTGGVIDVDVSRGAVRFRESELAGNVRVRVRARRSARAPGNIDLSGSGIEMRDVRVSSPSAEIEGWNGQTVMQPATLRLGKEPELEGDVSMDARDASPFLALLVRSSLPRTLGLTQVPHLLASARLTLGAGRLALRDVNIHGGDVALRGLYAIRDKHRRGEFTLEKGPLSIGLHVDDGGIGVRLFGLDAWSDRERGSVEEWFHEERGP
jgi:hypothetical protein